MSTFTAANTAKQGAFDFAKVEVRTKIPSCVYFRGLMLILLLLLAVAGALHSAGWKALLSIRNAWVGGQPDDVRAVESAWAREIARTAARRASASTRALQEKQSAKCKDRGTGY
jgi:hypothetical protein